MRAREVVVGVAVVDGLQRLEAAAKVRLLDQRGDEHGVGVGRGADVGEDVDRV